MPILPYILRKEQRFGTKLSRIRLIVTLFATALLTPSRPIILQVLILLLQLILRSGCAHHDYYYYEKCIEFTKRLIYFTIENNVTHSHPRQVYCFNLSSLNLRHGIVLTKGRFFSAAYHDIILLTCISNDRQLLVRT